MYIRTSSFVPLACNSTRVCDPKCNTKFSQSGDANLKEGYQPIIRPNFSENCMKMKKIGREGRLPKFVYVDTCVPPRSSLNSRDE